MQQFQLVNLLKQPIAPYLTGAGGKLIVTSPTEPVMIVFKLGFLVGLVLASPIILWQLWAFLAPALYAREKRALVPALFVGLVLFLTGAALAYVFVVPQALRVLFSFQTEAIQPFITYDAYFDFVLQVVLALGLSFELPLVIIILAWLEVISPADLARFRRFAVVAAFVAGRGALAGHRPRLDDHDDHPAAPALRGGIRGRGRDPSPAPEGGGHGRRWCCSGSGSAAAARRGAGARPSRRRPPAPRRPCRIRSRTPRRKKPGQALDSATAGRLGIPTAPTRSFAPDDSVLTALKARPGYQSTRYRADSATVFIEERAGPAAGRGADRAAGRAARGGHHPLPARQLPARRRAASPHLFDRGQVLVGEGIRYDTCRRRGIVNDALTNFTEGSTVWFLRGNVAQDSSSSRIYAGSSEITSCDLPTPHYHFSAREMKWVSKNVLVARPVVLYVRDVPILWLPFIFQDVRPGRHSGILVPQFGINDLVRPTRNYNRQITNIGYYWAPNDYLDLTGRLDWFANRYVQYGVSGQYRWLNRFMSGSIGFNEQRQVGGGSGLTFRWDHRQQFNLSTSLNFNLNYASNTAVIQRNAIDPLQNTQQITSSLNYSKRLQLGHADAGRQPAAESHRRQRPAAAARP